MDWMGGPEPKDVSQLEYEKVTLKVRLKKRIKEGLKLADEGIKNAGPNASIFWQGYKEALEFIKKDLWKVK